MMDLETDLQTLNKHRDKVLYGGHKSSITEWTLADVWSTVTTDKDHIRGLVNVRGLLITCNEASGEI